MPEEQVIMNIRDKRLDAKPIRILFGELLTDLGGIVLVGHEEQSSTASGVQSLLDGVFYTRAHFNLDNEGFNVVTEILLPPGMKFSIPGLEFARVAIGNEDYSTCWLFLSVIFGTAEDNNDVDFILMFRGLPARLLLDRNIIVPAVKDESGTFSESIEKENVAIGIDVTVEVSSGPDFKVKSIGGVSVEPFKVPITNSLYVEISNIKLDLSKTESLKEVKEGGFDDSFRGIYVQEVLLYFQDELEGLPSIQGADFVIGTGGISGQVAAEWVVSVSEDKKEFIVDSTDVIINLFGHEDVQFAIQRVAIEFETSVPVEFLIEGSLRLPVFENIVDAKLLLSDAGSIVVALNSKNGALVSFTKDELFRIDVNSFGASRSSQEVAFSVSGGIQFLDERIKETIPVIDLRGLTFYKRHGEEWAFRLESGSVEVNKSVNLFDVARADIKEIGLGNRNGTQVIEFSGGVLFEGIPAAGWVYGLRVPLEANPKIGLDGIGLVMVVPNTIMFKGEAIYVEENGTAYFQGGIGLTVIPTNLGIDASIKIGKNPSCRFGFISAEVTFPKPGIQIGSLPLYLTSVSGLTGINVKPDADTVLDLVPLFQRPPKGLTDASKWRDACGSHAIGFGVGISAANPDLITVSALLSFTFPEDLLLYIEGKAFVLESPKPGKEPPFHSLIALDIGDKTALMHIDADYEFVKGVIDAQGACEVYYGPDQESPGNNTQYLALGKSTDYFDVNEPVNAKILQLFGSRSYLYISPKIWDLGAEIGLPKKSYSFSFASVHFEAFLKGRGLVYWGPNQFNGTLDLTGNAGFRIFGKGFSVSLRSNVVGKTPDWYVDARLWFGVKFKILWKKYEFGGTIPFHWEKRITPPVPELLREVQLKSLIQDTSVIPYFAPINCILPSRGVVPEMEPDSAPALSFAFRAKDETGLPFGQDVNSVPLHQSGDHKYLFQLLEVKLSRMKISDWESHQNCSAADVEDLWEDFEYEVGGSSIFDYLKQNKSKPFLYGAWQATQDPQGIAGATELHLLARTPFDYNRPTRMRAEPASSMMDSTVMMGDGKHVDRNSTLANSAVNLAAQSLLAEETDSSGGERLAATGAISIPYYESNIKPAAELQAMETPLLYGSAQQAFKDQAEYPFGGVERFDEQGNPIPSSELVSERCHNFIQTTLSENNYLSPHAPIVIDGAVETEPIGTSGSVMIGGYADVTLRNGTVRRVGPCEITRDELYAYPFNYIEWHDDVAFDPTTQKLVSISNIEEGRIKILIREQVSKFTLHYESFWPDRTLPTYIESVTGEQCAGDTRLRFSSSESLPQGRIRLWNVYRKNYTSYNFWHNGGEVAFPNVDDNDYGVLEITAKKNGAFNEIVFEVSSKIRIYSLCYEVDHAAEIQTADAQLENYIDTIWPGRDSNDGSSWSSGPGDLDDDRFVTPEGGVGPGYLYRLYIKTNQERVNSEDTRISEYQLFYSVPRPPSNLSPYVLATVPRSDTFPHYRSYEVYLRMARNYVHKLLGNQNELVTIEIRREGEVIASLPFQNGKHSDLQKFLKNTNSDRKGWGWGKAGDGHLLTPEESVWMNAYNASAPVNRQISENMALPDDIIWAYPINPVFMRSDFSQQDSTSESIPGFQAAIDETGVPTPNRWKINAALLEHLSQCSDNETPNSEVAPESILLTSADVNEDYIASVWVRPGSCPDTKDTPRIGLVLATTMGSDNSLSRYLLVSIDTTKGKVSLVQHNTENSPARITKLEKRFSLPTNQWSRINVRVVMVSGKVAVTMHYGGEQIFSVLTDFSSLSGKVGLLANPSFRGYFDSLEVLSISRLHELPTAGAMHQLVVKYHGDSHVMEIHKTDFRASQYIDLFDHINAWDRNIYRSQNSVEFSDSLLLQNIDSWVQANEALIIAISDLDEIERDFAVKKFATLEDIEKQRIVLREARYELDERFNNIVTHLALELSPRPSRFEFVLANNGKGILIQSPEPIDWLRITARTIKHLGSLFLAADDDGTSITTRFTYSSDFTRAILILQSNETSVQPFLAGSVYVWTLKEYDVVPPHLHWLKGWVSHRHRDYKLTLEIPGE